MEFEDLRREATRILLALIVAPLTGIIAYYGGVPLVAVLGLLTPTLYLILELLEGIREGRGVEPDSLLMSLTGLLLLATGELLSGLVVMALYGAAELLEAGALLLARRRLESIRSLLPSRVLALRGEALVETSLHDVRTGDVIVARRGEIIPVDGVILDAGILDVSMLTGESTPLDVKPGDMIYSGSINLGDPVRVRVVRSVGESRLKKLVDLTMKSLEEKGRVARIIDRFLWLWLPTVILSSLAAYLTLGVKGAATILIVSCPSAFIITSSVNVAYSVARLARRGVIVRGARPLEGLMEADVLVLDKTGTLTLGYPSVVYVREPSGFDRDYFKTLVASVASTSLHPISRALAKITDSRIQVESVREHPGMGLEALVNGMRVLIGSRRLMEVNGLNVDANGCGEHLQTVWVSVDGSIGYICLEEAMRGDAWSLASLPYRVIIASGDSEGKVRSVALKLNVGEYYAELTPEDKLELVRKLRAQGHKVIFMGDGVNDAPAIAAANVGVAVGNLDVTMTTGDILVGDEPSKLLLAVREARVYSETLTISIVLIALVKLIALAGGLMGAPLPLVALIGDDGSTIAGLLATTAYRMIKTL